MRRFGDREARAALFALALLVLGGWWGAWIALHCRTSDEALLECR